MRGGGVCPEMCPLSSIQATGQPGRSMLTCAVVERESHPFFGSEKEEPMRSSWLVLVLGAFALLATVVQDAEGGRLCRRRVRCAAVNYSWCCQTPCCQDGGGIAFAGAPDGEKSADTSRASCSGNCHIRTTTEPPTGYPRGYDYCQICCIGSGDDGWYYVCKVIDGKRVYATRQNGLSVSVTCGGRTCICSCR